MNTKQYTKLSEQELKAWWNQRTSGHMAKVPFLPSEPIAYFDMDEKLELTIEVGLKGRTANFVKFVPTAFRKKPVNFSSKAFNANQVEFTFFGVNGHELALREQPASNQSQLDAIADLGLEKVEIPIEVEVKDSNTGNTLTSFQSVTVTELKGAKASNYAVPLTGLASLKLPNVIGIARKSLTIGDQHSESVGPIKFHLKSPQGEWRLQGVSVSANSYTDESALFSSQALQSNKPKMR